VSKPPQEFEAYRLSDNHYNATFVSVGSVPGERPRQYCRSDGLPGIFSMSLNPEAVPL
jgi:hypothetical protein